LAGLVSLHLHTLIDIMHHEHFYGEYYCAEAQLVCKRWLISCSSHVIKCLCYNAEKQRKGKNPNSKAAKTTCDKMYYKSICPLQHKVSEAGNIRIVAGSDISTNCTYLAAVVQAHTDRHQYEQPQWIGMASDTQTRDIDPQAHPVPRPRAIHSHLHQHFTC
jgi:hypothetical protein